MSDELLTVYLAGFHKRDDIVRILKLMVEEAYREGFADGSDFNNLPYKYPPVNIAWRTSLVRQKLTGKRETYDNGSWYRSGTVTDEATSLGTLSPNNEGISAKELVRWGEENGLSFADPKDVPKE